MTVATGALRLPRNNGKLESYTPGEPRVFTRPSAPLRSRALYAAAHVVCDPLADNVSETHLDWNATMAYRHHLWQYGLGVAEAMDTAQRGMGLSYSTTKALIKRATAEARAIGGEIACGASTDQLPASAKVTLTQIQAAYEEQCSFIEEQGGRIVLMASRHLAALAKDPEDYKRVYTGVLRQLSTPVIIHWLGAMFDPKLNGYWGAEDLDRATDICLAIIHDNADKIDGIKLSLLDRQREIDIRRQLPENVKMYTGNDLHYDELIFGDDQGYSHALLGIFDAVAPAASTAIQALDEGNENTYKQILEPTVPLSRHIFQAPTYYYKTGIVFLAYLNGHQAHFRMVGGLESARSVIHLAELFILADRAGLLQDPDDATNRMKAFLALAGVV